MKIDSFNMNSNPFRTNHYAQGKQSQNFARKIGDAADFASSFKRLATGEEQLDKKASMHQDRIDITKHNAGDSVKDNTAVMIENVKTDILRELQKPSDPGQVEQIKAQIEAGSYEIDAYAIAKKVMEFYNIG